jgi:hypothetical protein
MRPADRRRLIQRAIRDGSVPPAGLEQLAMRVALRQAGLRWIAVLYAVGFVVEVVSLFLESSIGAQVRDGALALVFAALGRFQYRAGLRAQDAVERWDQPPRAEPSPPG